MTKFSLQIYSSLLIVFIKKTFSFWYVISIYTKKFWVYAEPSIYSFINWSSTWLILYTI